MACAGKDAVKHVMYSSRSLCAECVRRPFCDLSVGLEPFRAVGSRSRVGASSSVCRLAVLAFFI